MQVFRYGKFENQIDIIPYITMYIHFHGYDENKRLWHFHINIQWAIWYFEIQIGKDDVY